jgi:lysophospholipase L1-like esterase
MRTRMRWRTVVAGLAMAVIGIAAAPGIANAESNGGTRIMPLGDSITEGVDVPGAYRTGLWQRLVDAKYKNDFVGTQFNGPDSLKDHDHEGHPGWRIEEVDAKVVGWLRESKPRSVLLHIGSNDVLQNYNVAGAPARLSTLVDHITETVPDADVFVATITPLGWTAGDAAVKAFNSTIPGMVKSKARDGKKVHLVDIHGALNWSDLDTDDVHPTAGGYDKMGEAWYNALRSVPGAIGSPSKDQPPANPPNKPPAKPPVKVEPDWIRHHAKASKAAAERIESQAYRGQ